MLVSKCCKSYLTIDGQTTHYYVCVHCGKATDAIESKGRIENADHSRTSLTEKGND